jgi:putative molybdopterin biosynthesis protein
VRKIELSYSLAEGRDPGGRVRNALLDLLQAVQSRGSITGAAQQLGLSYRHVWGELRRWEQTLGRPLIVWDKGQPARLTAFGEKLLWAERQAQARLAPQIEALRADLERAFAVAFDDSALVLALHASHDEALTVLRDLAVSQAGLHLDVHFCGSVDAIAALNAGRCTLAGFHVREGAALGSLAQRTYQPLLQPGRHKLIAFAHRRQGLLVAPGNPLGLASLADVVRTGARFARRGAGSGTRLLLDELLAESSLDARKVAGNEAGEPSHAAVAQAIASGAADAGLGIEAAARARGLGFVPLVSERYFLVCLKAVLDTPAVQALRRVLGSPAWHEALAALPGYAPDDGGQVLSLRQQLPWWTLPAKRKRA